MRKRAVALCMLLAGVVGGSLPVSAAPTCVTVEVIGPVIGDRTVTRCLPTPFTNGIVFGDCPSVPPAHLMVCLTVDLRTP